MSEISICFKASTLRLTSQQTCPTALQLKLSSRGAKNGATNHPPYCLGSSSMPYSWPCGQLEWGTARSRASRPLFADDLVLIARSCGDMSRLLEAVAGFCAWSWMRIKREKSVITGFDYKERDSISAESILYEGAPLTCWGASAYCQFSRHAQVGKGLVG